ncbi:cysteine-rich CWC family protein [Comamonas terrae]|uniref:Cysteine-rich CWC family protein n=1 Tax=Comamonas terrae TaxID=673548 RepID=A0ABW5UN39_9BURK|nr:cysteine-rich CWC family protein [Comamonas terrae]
MMRNHVQNRYTVSTTASSLNCPLCGQPNRCAIAAGLPAESCWCMRAEIPRQALARIPEPQRGKACICPACGRRQPGDEPPPSAA